MISVYICSCLSFRPLKRCCRSRSTWSTTGTRRASPPLGQKLSPNLSNTFVDFHGDFTWIYGDFMTSWDFYGIFLRIKYGSMGTWMGFSMVWWGIHDYQNMADFWGFVILSGHCSQYRECAWVYWLGVWKLCTHDILEIWMIEDISSQKRHDTKGRYIGQTWIGLGN